MIDEKVASSPHNRRRSTPEKWEGIEHVDPICDDDIVGGVVLSNPIVFGVPDRSEIFRLAVLTDGTVDIYSELFTDAGKWLRVINPVQLQLPDLGMTAPPGQEARAVAESAVDVRMQATSCDIALRRIRALECKVTDEGREVVFEGTEVTGPATDRTIRVLQVTIHANGLAAHEVISEAPYPR